MDFKMHKSGLKGQNLAEYTLIGAFLILVCAGVWVVVGQGYSAQLSFFQPSSSTKPGSGSFSNQNPQTATSPVPNQNEASAATNDPLLPNANVLSLVETAGASGATITGMQQLQQLVKSLYQKGAISAKESGQLNALANQGYRIASIMSYVEQVAQQYPDPQTFKETPVTFEGQTYSNAFQLVHNTIDTYILSEDKSNISLFDPSALALIPVSDNTKESLKFIQLLQQANASGVLADPTLKRYVEQLAKDVLAIADGMGTNTNLADMDNLKAPKNSLPTEKKSDDICTTGSGQINQGQCY